MNGDIKIWDIRQSDIPISSTNAFANGLSSMAIHSHCPVFAATSAPYASSSYNDGGRAGHGGPQNGVRRGQRLNIYRMDDDLSRDYDSTSYGFDAGGRSSQYSGRASSRAERYSGLPSNWSEKQSQASAYINGPDTEADGPQPRLLSSAMIRGDGGHVSAPSTPSVSGLPGDVYENEKRQNRASQTQSKRRWGAGMNALAFHPVCAVSIFGG